jgi:hypothetical protein
VLTKLDPLYRVVLTPRELARLRRPPVGAAGRPRPAPPAVYVLPPDTGTDPVEAYCTWETGATLVDPVGFAHGRHERAPAARLRWTDPEQFVLNGRSYVALSRLDAVTSPERAPSAPGPGRGRAPNRSAA